MSATLNRPSQRLRARRTAEAEVERACIAPFSTYLGWMAVAWRDDLLIGNAFGHASRRSAELALARMPGLPPAFCRIDVDSRTNEVPARIIELVDMLYRFADGDDVVFSEVALSLDHLTPFGRRVIAACRAIPWGQTRSYGELAAQCGSPGAARAVGSVMAKNRFPLIVPCHRVLAAGGELGGYSAPDGLEMKRRLLGMEGWAKS